MSVVISAGGSTVTMVDVSDYVIYATKVPMFQYDSKMRLTSGGMTIRLSEAFSGLDPETIRFFKIEKDGALIFYGYVVHYNYSRSKHYYNFELSNFLIKLSEIELSYDKLNPKLSGKDTYQPAYNYDYGANIGVRDLLSGILDLIIYSGLPFGYEFRGFTDTFVLSKEVTLSYDDEQGVYVTDTLDFTVDDLRIDLNAIWCAGNRVATNHSTIDNPLKHYRKITVWELFREIISLIPTVVYYEGDKIILEYKPDYTPCTPIDDLVIGEDARFDDPFREDVGNCIFGNTDRENYTNSVENSVYGIGCVVGESDSGVLSNLIFMYKWKSDNEPYPKSVYPLRSNGMDISDTNLVKLGDETAFGDLRMSVERGEKKIVKIQTLDCPNRNFWRSAFYDIENEIYEIESYTGV